MDFNPGGDGGAYTDIPTRPMRVKVLYSFDSDNKTNCLARFPNTLQIPAVAIDDNAQVGVIELKQCIQAVVTASPEILSKLSDSDYTIYAFDYSEYETPLVGQGMLSTALAAAPVSPGNEKTMITGRVCQNMPAIFNNGVKETLEVKLRLVPVHKTGQNNAARSELYRGTSPAMSAGFDPNAWSASMSQHRSQHSADMFNFDPNMTTGDALMDELLGVGHAVDSGSSGRQTDGGVVGTAETRTENSMACNPTFATNFHSAPGSRSGSPIMSSNSSTSETQLRHQSFSGHPQNSADHSQPASRASIRNEAVSPGHKRHASTQSSYAQHTGPNQTEVYYNEDGQQRKRAKVMQADWRGKGSFGSKHADLRVTAATAASMHMMRPLANKSAAPGSDLEPPPRVPTPVPRRTALFPSHRPLQTAQARSMLRQASVADSELGSDYEICSDAIASSPEDHSPNNSITADGTPQEIPSSPPVFHGINQPTPSSPCLPSARFDSGYMSEHGLTSSLALEDFDNQSQGRGYSRMRRQSSQTFVKIEGDGSDQHDLYRRDATPLEIGLRFETPGDMAQLSSTMRSESVPPFRQRDPSQRANPASQAMKRNADRPDGGPATPGYDAPTPLAAAQPCRRGSLALPPNPLPVPSSQQLKKAPTKRKSLKRSGTFNDSEAGSPAPSDTEGGGRPRGPRRSGSGAPRSVLIKERLEQAISKGETPQYCNHCGAIETPTWRKLYVKYVDGKPSLLDSAEGEGETISVEILAHDDEGKVTRFVIRKSMKRTKDFQPGPGFEPTTLCNPCGLWFNKFRQMRPADRWHKKSGSRRSKKKLETGDTVFMTDGAEPQSEAFFTDQIGPDDTAGVIVEGSTRESQNSENAMTLRRSRARSMEAEATSRDSQSGPFASQLNAVSTRQVQSSPIRAGSQDSPVEIEDPTPKQTRRLLFPSPRKEGEVKSLHDNGQVSRLAAPALKKKQDLSSKIDFAAMDIDVNIFEAFTVEKENIALPGETDDDFAHLFDGSPVAFKTPKKILATATITPRSQRRLSHLLQTPTPASRRSGHLNENADAANQVSNDFMTSPSNTRYFLRSTPSRRDRTPAQRSVNGSNEISPFSRHLAQMLSDANDPGPHTSPSRAFDFSDLPTFTTPGRNMDWSSIDDILSSEFAAFDGSGESGGTGSES